MHCSSGCFERLICVKGAHIILDAMCGGGATELASATSKSQLGKPNPPMTDEVGSQVVAIIQMGDPRAIQGTTYNKGTAKGAGVCVPDGNPKILSQIANPNKDVP